MRRFLLFFMLIALSIGTLYAQRRNPFPNELHVGFGGGATMSSVDFQQPSVLASYRFGTQGGISIKHISDGHHTVPVRAGIIAELNFSQQGWQEVFDQEERPGFAYSRTLNYVTLPFMTHINWGRGNVVRFFFNAGPQIGLLLGDSYTMSEALADHLDEVLSQRPPGFPYGMQYRPSSDLKRFDYGIIAGTGLQILTGRSGHINVEGRFYFGLGDIFESRRGRQALFGRSANLVFGVRVTYYRRIF